MAEQSFEKALEELEEIVDKLEEGGLSLDESLGFFEKGVKLARFLRAELDKAEKKIEILLKDESGELKPSPFVQEESAPETTGGKDIDIEEDKDSGPDSENSGSLPF